MNLFMFLTNEENGFMAAVSRRLHCLGNIRFIHISWSEGDQEEDGDW